VWAVERFGQALEESVPCENGVMNWLRIARAWILKEHRVGGRLEFIVWHGVL
jgi:hypothetical protein